MIAGDIEIIRGRHFEPCHPGFPDSLVDRHEPIRVGVAQRPQEHGVDEAEDRAVGTDAERQCEHRDQREGRRLHQRSEGLPEVVEERPHRGFSVWIDGAGDARDSSMLGHRVGGSQRNGGQEIGNGAPPRVRAAARLEHLDEIGLQVVAEPLAELAPIGAEQHAVRRPGKTVAGHLRLAWHQSPGLHQRDQSRQAARLFAQRDTAGRLYREQTAASGPEPATSFTMPAVSSRSSVP